MATQWNYTFAPGQVLPASTMTSLGAPFETWTPNFRPGGGGVWFVTNTPYARYGRIGKFVFGEASFNITSAGTGAGFVQFDLPIVALNGNPGAIGGGREANLTGASYTVSKITTAVGQIVFYNNGATANGNYSYSFNFFYEAV